VVFSSHCIEHQPDLIRHLEGVARILKDGGTYYLAVPDKRFCFDHFIQESETAEIVRAHEERRTVHTFKSLYNNDVMTTHNDERRHWCGDSTDPRLGERAARAEYARKRFAEAHGAYIDVHAWQFTPASFRRCMTELFAKGLSPLRPLRVYDTVYAQNEFMAALSL
jgi:SAM-dependent methyltransferase